jgi:hypothetical protein
MNEQSSRTAIWPDPLEASDAAQSSEQLAAFWHVLSYLPQFVQNGEGLLAAELVQQLRAIVIDLMLALNGIRRPPNTRHLNSYLSPSQRAALERTLAAPAPEMDAWIGQAVALTVIYRWYAPQLTDRFGLDYPQGLEDEVWQALRRSISAWPATITSDP